MKFSEMEEAPPRERAALARTAITTSMNGPKKMIKFGFLLKGVFITASAILNQHTKFAKLQVGKHFVSAKQRHAQDYVFPLTISLNGLGPLSKV